MRMVFRALACISTPYIRPKGVGFSSAAIPLANGPTITIMLPSFFVAGHRAGSGGGGLPA